MRNKSQFLLILFALILTGCSSQQNHSLHSTVDDYYQTYSGRSDFEYFLSFYDSAMVLEDIILGERVEGIENFRTFFDWPNPNFEMKDSIALVITNQIIGESQVVTSGYFAPFSWGGTDVEAMHFTTILSFNENGKIVHHIDWINYPTYLVNYETRKNSNEWIGEK